MTLDEYFGGWIRVIDIKELNKVTSKKPIKRERVD